MNEIQAVGVEVASLAPAPSPLQDGKRSERPWIYGLLIAPSAVVANGVVQGGVLAYLLSQQGVGSMGQSHLIVLFGLPTWLYFLWSPITDFFVKRRTWLVAGAVTAAASMAIAFHLHSLSSPTSEALMLLSACCSQLVVSSCGGMMGAMSSERAKRASSGFYQAGSMGFGALATWAAHPHELTPPALQTCWAWAAAAMIALPALLAFIAPRQKTIATGSFAESMERVWTEFRATFFRWEALPYAACMTFPMASGSAIGLLPGVAQQYGVNGDSVAWINGLLGGALMAAGSVAMGAIRYKMRAGQMYMIVALINCATLAVLWLGPLQALHLYGWNDLVPLHCRRRLCNVHRSSTGVHGPLRQERQYALQHHQLAGERASAVHADRRWHRRRTLGRARSGRGRVCRRRHRRNHPAHLFPDLGTANPRRRA